MTNISTENNQENNQEHRAESFGMKSLSRLDKLIYFLRVQAIKKYCNCEGKIIMDVGCGYNADFLRYIQDTYKPSKSIAFDLRLNSDYLKSQNVISIEGDLNKDFDLDTKVDMLGTKVDMIFATAILEHLNKAVGFLKNCYNNLNDGGMILLTTPSIWSQPILEFLAYKLKIISEEEIRDHKEYFDRKQLFNYFQQAGFKLENIHHEYFEFGMNNLVVAKK